MQIRFVAGLQDVTPRILERQPVISVGAFGESGVIEAGGVGWFWDIATDLAVSFLEQPLVPKKKTANTDVTISEPTSAAVFCLRLNFFPQNRGRWFAPRIFDA